MQKRTVHSEAYPEALEAMLALSRAVQKTGLGLTRFYVTPLADNLALGQVAFGEVNQLTFC
jgi:hypothetical protein